VARSEPRWLVAEDPGVIFALPLYDDNPIRRTPVVTYVLILMCIGAFLWELGQHQDVVAYQYGMIPAVLFGYVELPRALQPIPPWATIFTSMFLHGGWLHLGGNMLFLWIFGNNIEDVLGRARYLILYLGSGVAAAMAQALVDKLSQVPMLGASGAIAGVLGAYFLLHPRANVRVLLVLFVFVRFINMPAVVVLGLWFLVQFISIAATPAGEGDVAVWAHAAGFLAGIVLIPLFKDREVPLFGGPYSAAFAVVRARDMRRAGSVPDAGDLSWRRRRGPWER
jgi:membrane associated rhomboid family serine protease